MITSAWVLTLLIFVSVAGLSWLCVRWMIAYLTRREMLDTPNNRTLHTGAVPRGGGLVIAVFLVLSSLLMAVVFPNWILYVTLALLMAGWAGLGWYDDQHDLTPQLRFPFQLILAVATVATLGWVNTILSVQLGWFGLGLTVIGILWMANLYNFMDGMDGLAASQAIVASITLSFWFSRVGNTGVAMVCVVVAAACYGFLLWNWRPAKVFMGDVGSITLGAFFATMIVLASNRHDFPVLSLLILFAVFVADASITILRRAWYREKIWLPHRTHYYQRLANIGVSHQYIVCAAILLMLICSLLATITVLYRDMIGVALVSVGILLGSVIALVRWLESQHEKNQHLRNSKSELND
ncbi:glycosyl transferase [Arenicella chitinivorans]|uniref:Glycosyl transferase n=1 Tax=Arenicella chitinivorans TaxID=1329800 RepID=A0A918VQL5_9GAMM|nr:glycosyltransferase family 4 protein [Arenicella chitinivorans]GHA16963.1 glycosyl transferase [Arenicella chitinivorans]